MKKIIEKFKPYLGSHCSSSQMSNLLRYYGLEISEELCFGIGAGLGFIYRKAFNPPLYFLLGRSDDLEEKIAYHLGGMAIPYTTDDNRRAWEEVKKLIDCGQPVIINVDASYIGYLRERFNLFRNVRYGGHRVTIVGYDDQEEIAYVADYLWDRLQKVPYSELELARSSPAGQTPPRNLFYTFFFPNVFISLEQAIINGIRLNVHSMLNPWFEILGLDGVKKFCERVTSWPRFMKPEMAMENAYMTYMMFEVVGTGGGNFRRLYARFLRQAADALGDTRLNLVYKIYADLANKWKEIAFLMKESAEDISAGIWSGQSTIKTLLDEVYEKEEKGINLLRELYYG